MSWINNVLGAKPVLNGLAPSVLVAEPIVVRNERFQVAFTAPPNAELDGMPRMVVTVNTGLISGWPIITTVEIPVAEGAARMTNETALEIAVDAIVDEENLWSMGENAETLRQHLIAKFSDHEAIITWRIA